jgi:HD-like signal output (HDOD) protein
LAVKPRNTLSAVEIDSLHQRLAERLERIGIHTQPEVAVRILDLSADPNAQPRDYAAAIRNDPGLSGRLLKLSNSALFAQRKPVTTVDRACVVLGLERLKSIALGFHLSRAACRGTARELTRSVWGRSVFRGCLAAELARLHAPGHVAEAFVIGLMLDAGVPLMPKLVGDAYERLYDAFPAPRTLLRAECEALEFTHVDVMAALQRLWRLPEVLARPIQWHHDRPRSATRAEPVHALHRIAYVVAGPELSVSADLSVTRAPDSDAGLYAEASQLLGLHDSQIEEAVRRASAEYAATIDLFGEIAKSIGDAEDIFECIQMRLVRAVDAQVEDSIRREHDMRRRFKFGDQCVEVSRDKDGFVACLFDSEGSPLVTHRFQQDAEDERTVLAALGVEVCGCDDTQRLREFITKAA